MVIGDGTDDTQLRIDVLQTMRCGVLIVVGGQVIDPLVTSCWDRIENGMYFI